MLLAGSTFLLRNDHVRSVSYGTVRPFIYEVPPGTRNLLCINTAQVCAICLGSLLEKYILVEGFVRLLGRDNVSISLSFTISLISEHRLWIVGYKMLI